MTQLSSLRRRIAALRRWRALMRWVTAWSGLLTAALCGLAAIFALDVIFEMDVPQRVLVMTLGAAAWVWLAVRSALPLLRVRESLLQVALLVERQHAIRNDLVAALEFDTPAASTWGSPQLEQAVIEQVAARSGRLPVFAGFTHPQARRRVGLLALTLAASVAAGVLFPQHAAIFARRLALAADHYPSATRIEAVTVNGQIVLLRQQHPTRPAPSTVAEGQPITLRVQVSGRLPEGGRAVLQADGGRRRTLPLDKLTLDQRRALLEETAARIRAAIEQEEGPGWARSSEDIVATLRLDAADAAARLEQSGSERARLEAAAESLAERLADWPGDAAQAAIYEFRLNRLVDAVGYQLHVGDAWTDPAEIRMIRLPAVELTMEARPPDYAASAEDAAAISSSRQLSVLEGSQVRLAILSTNGKPLTAVWASVADGTTSTRFALQPEDPQGLRWSLPPEGTPFAKILRETRFELQVTDRDGLHLETPLRGYLRIKADRLPTCSADIVHRVVLPTARPTIAYRVNDDYGIARLMLSAQIERQAAAEEGGDNPRVELSILGDAEVLAAERLPASGSYTLDLAALSRSAAEAAGPAAAPLQLVKGDRLKLTLEAVDFRGDQPGQACQSEPLVLEISDESGVLAAISDADQRSEERLTEIIKQQLGIGETP